MKTQSTSAVLAGIMSGVAAACVCFSVALALHNRSLQSELAASRELWSKAVGLTAELRVQHAATAADLATHRERLSGMAEQIAALESRSATNGPASPRPVLARIYDGNRFVGLGWINTPSTNSPGSSRDGLPVVFLNRGTGPATTEAAYAPSSTGPSGGASLAYAYQTYPYYWGSVWPGGWMDTNCFPQGEPTPLPAPEIQPDLPTPPPAGPSQYTIARTWNGTRPAPPTAFSRPTPVLSRSPAPTAVNRAAGGTAFGNFRRPTVSPGIAPRLAAPRTTTANPAIRR